MDKFRQNFKKRLILGPNITHVHEHNINFLKEYNSYFYPFFNAYHMVQFHINVISRFKENFERVYSGPKNDPSSPFLV